MAPEAGSNIYTIKNLSFRIRNRTILDVAGFEICAGEYAVVIGPNGAGKSTLLRNMIRVIRPPHDSVKLYGKCLLDYRQRDIAAIVGYVPQSAPIYLPFTAQQFVMMGLYPSLNPLVRPGSEEADRAMSYLVQVGMKEFHDRQMDTLSGGERQKIFIAAALAQNPDIILLDEPTTFLDPKHQCDIQDILGRLNTEKRLAVLAVTHDINFATRFARRVIALKNGKIFFDDLV